jgi:calcium-dependent protein kinase
VCRDLKPENFLLETAAPDAVLKLTDFGLSALLSSPDEVLHEGCGSAYYIAPEIFRKRYTRAVDVFALGVILFIMWVPPTDARWGRGRACA